VVLPLFGHQRSGDPSVNGQDAAAEHYRLALPDDTDLSDTAA